MAGTRPTCEKAEIGLVTFLGDLKDNVGAVPLGFVFDEVNLASETCHTTFLPGTSSVMTRLDFGMQKLAAHR
jgi:hypothetical protein